MTMSNDFWVPVLHVFILKMSNSSIEDFYDIIIETENWLIDTGLFK